MGKFQINLEFYLRYFVNRAADVISSEYCHGHCIGSCVRMSFLHFFHSCHFCRSKIASRTARAFSRSRSRSYSVMRTFDEKRGVWRMRKPQDILTRYETGCSSPRICHPTFWQRHYVSAVVFCRTFIVHSVNVIFPTISVSFCIQLTVSITNLSSWLHIFSTAVIHCSHIILGHGPCAR